MYIYTYICICHQLEYGRWPCGDRQDGAADQATGATAPAQTSTRASTQQGPASRGQRSHVLSHNGTIGRSKSCALHIPRSSLSRLHAKVTWREGGAGQFVLRNCSRNNSYHNGKPVGEAGAPLAQGDIIFLGKSSCLTVVQVYSARGVGGDDAEGGPTITLDHTERGLSCATQHSSSMTHGKSRASKLPNVTAPMVNLDGEPLEEDGVDAGEEGVDAQEYRDRAAERRSLNADSEVARRSHAYRTRQRVLQQQEAVREDKTRRLNQLEANLATIDAACFRAPGTLPSLSELEKMTAEKMIAAAPDPDWKERGAKMLKMMGWEEGQGLGRNKTGITSAVETSLNAGKSGLGLAAEMSSKVAHKINRNLGAGGETDY